MVSKVEEVYTKYAEAEWQRLERSAYRYLEFSVTMHYLRKYLPAGGTILDAGGGPGRYSIALCREEFPVTLLDLAPGNIEFARMKFADEPAEVQEKLVDALVGDVRRMPFPDAHFDAVLCLGGPLTHIPDPAERMQAVHELVRVAKPGGVVCLTGIGYLAVLRTVMAEFSHELINGSVEAFLVDGNAIGSQGMAWHFFRADELRALAEAGGLITLEMAGCQSLSTGMKESTNRLQQEEEKWQCWQDLLLRFASEPAVVDMAEHILYIGRVRET